jgi:hypothetical protein
MLKAHVHVGCNVYEIQSQKEEHQSFQETAKVRDFCPYVYLVASPCEWSCSLLEESAVRMVDELYNCP